MRGVIRGLRASFGFVSDSTGRTAFYFSANDTAGIGTFRPLRVGMVVEFEPVEPEPERGPRARRVRRVTEAGR